MGEPLSKLYGADAPDVVFSAALDPDCGAQVLIDFSGPRAFDAALALARERKLAFISGTTGLSDEQRARMDDAARTLGCGPAAVLARVHGPVLRGSLLTAGVLVFVDVMKELPATLLLRPLNVETLATSIYQYASRGSFEEGALAALLIVAASIGPVAWLTRFSDMPTGPA